MDTNIEAKAKSKLKSFDDGFDLEFERDMISFRFLSIIDEIMEDQNISKSELAEMIGTSASYITQLFRGSKLVNVTLLAKLQEALGFKFEVSNSSAKEKQTVSNEYKYWGSKPAAGWKIYTRQATPDKNEPSVYWEENLSTSDLDQIYGT